MKCLIWNTSAIEKETERDGTAVISSRAGGFYFVSDSVASNLYGLDETEKVLLTSWLVDRRIKGDFRPEILSTTFNSISKDYMTAHERACNLLWYLYLRYDLLGTVLAFGDVRDEEKNENLSRIVGMDRFSPNVGSQVAC